MSLEYLDRTRGRLGFALFAYVVMPNHVHLLLAVNGTDLPSLIRDWKSQCGFAISRARQLHAPLWQARYFDFILRRVADFWDKFDYIHQNPVRAGLVTNANDWRWSSCRHYSKLGAAAVEPDPIYLPMDRNAPLWPAPWL